MSDAYLAQVKAQHSCTAARSNRLTVSRNVDSPQRSILNRIEIVHVILQP
jgi:hypothetical protein